MEKPTPQQSNSGFYSKIFITHKDSQDLEEKIQSKLKQTFLFLFVVVAFYRNSKSLKIDEQNSQKCMRKIFQNSVVYLPEQVYFPRFLLSPNHTKLKKKKFHKKNQIFEFFCFFFCTHKVFSFLISEHGFFLGFNFPHIVGTDWRMDYCIKTDTLGHVGKPIYYISLKTEKNLKLPESSVTEIPKMEQENVDFTCNLEELQDLVSKLKDATKQMERVQSELTP